MPQRYISKVTMTRTVRVPVSTQCEHMFCCSALSSLALEEETDSVSQDTADRKTEEERLEDTSERDALLGSSGTPEVEDSFL